MNKYSVGQDIWFMYRDKPVTMKIVSIDIDIRDKTSVRYNVGSPNINGYYSSVEERDAFLSLDSLLESFKLQEEAMKLAAQEFYDKK